MRKISLIIPTYNEESVILDCLKSLEEQSYGDFEVIVVDDGSTDSTLERVEELRVTGYGLRVVKQNHLGPGAARNLGAKKASGEILVFVDADMTFDKNFLKKLVAPIISGEVVGTFSKQEYVKNWDNVWAKCWNINEGWEDKRRHPKDYPDKQNVFRAVKKTEFEKVGGFDSSLGYMDDWSLSKKLGVMAVDAPGAKFYHKNPESLSEIYTHAKWVAKRPYKFGTLGSFIALVRASLPISLVVGAIKSLINKQPAFFVFKIVYDGGLFVGLLEKLITRKVSK